MYKMDESLEMDEGRMSTDEPMNRDLEGRFWSDILTKARVYVRVQDQTNSKIKQSYLVESKTIKSKEFMLSTLDMCYLDKC